MLGREEGLRYEIHVDGVRLEQMFKYLGWVLDELGTDGVNCWRKVENRRKVTGAIRSVINVMGLQLECVSFCCMSVRRLGLCR